jgi:uncharacterized protein (TIGR04255 family)
MILRKSKLIPPVLIEPCPIVEAVCEIRFDPIVPAEAVFGMAYSKIQSHVGNPIATPLAGLAAQLLNDPNLRFQPHYRFESKNYLVQLGPQVFSVVTVGAYPGWPKFSTKVRDVMHAFFSAGVLDKISRLGLRYINFFDAHDIYKNIDLEIKFEGTTVDGRETTFSTILADEFNHHVQIRKDNFMVAQPDHKGSIIDIDSFALAPKTDLKNFDKLIEVAHSEEKQIFFGLLKTEFLAQFKPQYPK